MGSYLPTPAKKKYSEDSKNDRLMYGASCMQGWRVSQEDAHNCILNFDDGVSLFAVYDGHGGCEIAVYCSLHLPEYIKHTSEYKSKDYTQALISGFLGFDETLINADVRKELQSLIDYNKTKHSDEATESSEKPSDDNEDFESEHKENVNITSKRNEDDDLANVQLLHKEAEMPLAEIMEKLYRKKLVNKIRLTSSKNQNNDIDEKPCTSGYKKNSKSNIHCNATDDTPFINKENLSDGDTKVEEKGKPENIESRLLNGNVDDTNGIVSSDINDDRTEGDTVSNVPENSACVLNSRNSPSGKGKGKLGPAILSPTKVTTVTQELLSGPVAEVTYDSFKLKLFKPSEDESDSDDDTFEISTDKLNDSSDIDDTVDNEDDEDSEESDESKEEVNTDEDNTDEKSDDEINDDSDNDDDMDDDDDSILLNNCIHVPGVNSGCTAVVALFTEDSMYVANAGDSRCVASKAGVAFDLSSDHKPEDEIERMRIKRAGGSVWDGRVNNGLNLSRAIGDHHYKRNKSFPNTEQMITAMPDVSVCHITPEIEFVVLACDGIWNSMSSQEVVDFIKSKLNMETKLSQICEELFDKCLAPNTCGDGTGCDNMTCIIVQLLPVRRIGKKNFNSDVENELVAAKRQKTEEAVSTDKSSCAENVET